MSDSTDNNNLSEQANDKGIRKYIYIIFIIVFILVFIAIYGSYLGHNSFFYNSSENNEKVTQQEYQHTIENIQKQIESNQNSLELLTSSINKFSQDLNYITTRQRELVDNYSDLKIRAVKESTTEKQKVVGLLYKYIKSVDDLKLGNILQFAHKDIKNLSDNLSLQDKNINSNINYNSNQRPVAANQMNKLYDVFEGMKGDLFKLISIRKLDPNAITAIDSGVISEQNLIGLKLYLKSTALQASISLQNNDKKLYQMNMSFLNQQTRFYITKKTDTNVLDLLDQINKIEV